MATIPLRQDIVRGECFSFPIRSPNAFGPSMWFTLHNGSANYPINPTKEEKSLMKGFIKGVPLMIPCRMCQSHFNTIIINTNLDKVVSSRESLFQFFFTAHNSVNKRLGKTTITLDQAKRMYAFDGGVGNILIKLTRTKD